MADARIVGYVPPPGSQERTKLLKLKVIAGHNLAKKDIFGASDPYLRIDLVTKNGEEVEDSVLTKTKKRTLNPKWEEEFIFRVKPNEHKLVLEVFDENRLTRDDFLGMVELPLTGMPKEIEGRVVPHKYYILRPRSARSKVRGHLQLYHAFVPEPHSTNQGSDGEPPHAAASNEGESYPQNTSHNESSGDNAWEVVSTSNEPATSIDGAANSSAEAFVMESNNTSPGAGEMASTIPTLPQGWEERQDANGRTYYVNHVSRSTQWNHPGVELDDVNSSDVDTRRRRFHISQDDTISVRERQSIVSENDSTIDHLHNLSIQGETSHNLLPSEDRRDQTDAGIGSTRQQSSSDSTNSTPNTTGATGGASTRTPGATANDSVRWNTEGQEGLPEGWTLQVAPNGRVFYINHAEKKTTWVDPRSGRPSQFPSATNVPNRRHEDDLGPLPEGWEERVHTDGRIFFIDHNTRATQWEDPRISNPTIAGPAIPYSRDYKRKFEFLKAQLKKPSNVPNKLEIKVRRNNVLEDSYRQIQVAAHKVDILKTKLWIEFDGEVGLDYGGVAREWFYLLSKEMFNPYYGLFEYSATDNYTLQINPYSGLCNDDHLLYFKFIGRVAGMAVYHGKLLDGFFIRPFYKMMLGKVIELKDMESVDTEYYNSLQWIKENDPAELDLEFQVEDEQFGTIVSKELKPGGAKISVTNENKDEYIRLVVHWRFVSRIQQQMDSFLAGFNELVPLNHLKIFDEGELELLMCGIGSIDVKDWKHNTVYKGDYHPNHIVIQWFWRVVLSFNNEMRSRLLQFVTGTSRVPMNGFKELYGSNGPQPFTIEKWGSPNNFPRAHTCFNRLDLPPYESYQQLRERMIRAIEGSEGFAGVD